MPADQNRPDGVGDRSAGSNEHQSLEEFRATLGGDETWATPPPAVAEAVFEAISAESGQRVVGRQEPGSLWSTWPIGARAAAGAVVVALVIAATALFPAFRTDPFTATLDATEFFPSASGTATIESAGAGWSILLDLDLPPAEDGHYYEGWVWNEAGEGVSIGTFHLNEADGSLSLWSGVSIEEYPMVWVSLQEVGGGPELSDRVVLRGSIDR